jgi:hypothetical protein
LVWPQEEIAKRVDWHGLARLRPAAKTAKLK